LILGRGALLAAALFAMAPSGHQTDDLPPWDKVDFTLAPFVIPAGAPLGALTYAGGLFLTTPKSNLFGGVSGLEAEAIPDGSGVKFAGITDQGYFLTFHGDLDSAGRLVGAGNLTLAPLRDTEGHVLLGKGERDAEDLSRPPDANGWLVSFERHHRVLAYVDPFDADADVIALNIPATAKKLPANRGMEAIAALPGGRIAVGAEDGRLWLCPPSQQPCPLIHPKGGQGVLFYLTGLDYLPGTTDEMVAVYRRPTLLNEFESKIVHVWLRNGVASETVLADLPKTVGNVEGVSAVAAPGGGYRLYIVTDNNFDEATPTRLLAFDWKRPGT
jgi:hypothetical protein